MNSDDWLCSRKNCYALVAYLPDPLARFLDDLRRELVPGSDPHAHVTLLPPRPLADDAEALRQVQEYFAHVPPFEVEAGALNVFGCTNVIFLEIGVGREKLVEIHQDLNCGAVNFCAAYPYHPHITLAQELTGDQVPRAAETARKAWAQYPYPRRFLVEKLSFVQNTENNTWLDLATVRLGELVHASR